MTLRDSPKRYNRLPYQASGAFPQTMMTICTEVLYAVPGVELVSVGNSTGAPPSALLKPRPVCRVKFLLSSRERCVDGQFRLRFWDLWNKLA